MAAPFASPGIAYLNRRIDWGCMSANYLRNEGRELPSSLFENTMYDIIFYAHTNDENDIHISRTAQGRLHFVPSAVKSDTNIEYLEEDEADDDGRQQRTTVITKPAADYKSYAATIDMPRDSVGQDLSDHVLGRHLELLLNGFRGSCTTTFDFTDDAPQRRDEPIRLKHHGKFLLLNRDDDNATKWTKWKEDTDYLYDVVEADLQVFGERIPLFLDRNPAFFSTNENEMTDGESSESQQDSSEEDVDNDIENGAYELTVGEENEADLAQERLESFRDVETWWASRHFPNLPDSVLYNIRCFCTPQPVFFLEQGDLWIQLRWSDDDFTVSVARLST